MARLSVIRHEIVVGWFIVGALLVAGIALMLKDRSDGLLATHQIKFTLDHGRGLDVNSKVLIQGIQVGEISKIELTDDNKVDVTCKVKERYAENIRSDAVATVIQPPLLGSSKIEISPGTAQEAAKDEQRLEVRPQVTFLDKVTDLEGRVDGVLVRVNEFVLTAVKTLDGLRLLIERIDQSKGLAGQLIHDETLAKELRKSVAQLNDVLGNASSITKRVDDEGVDKAFETLDAGKKLVEDLNRPDGDLRTLLRDTDDAVVAMTKAIEQAELARTAETVRTLAESLTATSEKMAKATAHVGPMSKDAQDAFIAFREASDAFRRLSVTLDRQPSSVIFGKKVSKGPGLRR